MHKKTVVIDIVALSIFAVVWVLLFASKSGKHDEQAAPRPTLTITTARPSQEKLPICLNANGTVFAWQEAVIGSESNSLQLTDVRVNVGDTVRRGQVLPPDDGVISARSPTVGAVVGSGT